MGIEFLIVGLGNPGAEYESTPHNMGFRVIAKLAARHAIRVTRKENTSLVGLGAIPSTAAAKQVALAQPQTFMNLSGGAVKGLVERYEIPLDHLVLVYDELALPFGSLRVRVNGSSAGHNGVKSVIGSLGTDAFIRLRIGIHPGVQLGRPVEGLKYVLAPYRRAELKDVEETVDRAADAVETIIAEGASKAMAKYNRRAQGLTNEEE